MELEIDETEISELYLKQRHDSEIIFAAAQIFKGYSRLE